MRPCRHLVSWILLAILFGTLVTAGCGSTRSTNVVPSGFLGDLSSLETIDARGGGDVLVREPGILGRYDRFLLDPVVIVFAEGSGAQAIDPKDLAELTSSLSQKVITTLREGGYEVVDTPGPGVLRIRAALTDVDPAGPVANVGGKVAGIASGVGGFVVPAIDLGGAAIEAEMIDGSTGERVAAYRDARRGKRFGGVLDASRRWGHAEEAFDVWASELRARLDELHDKE